MRAATPKQYVPLAGRPLLWHAVRALCVPQVSAVFVVLAANDEHFARQDWSAFAGKVNPLYCGGATRRDSVLNGLVAVGGAVDADDWMLVHDAARPCLPAADLRRLLDEGAGDAIGAILALPVAETVKRAGKDEGGVQRVAATEDRSQLWLAQTPQLFRTGLLIEALSRAANATDEAAAVEALGHRPRLVLGSRENLKVTYEEDVAIAAAILAGRK
ncbi:MAG: 2-C-methyl-D-erythritol 4-phosphate cytidylyltransferase [Betaproteobacteria bacterium]|nr:MAG: 2-C-methyl-D-erythritol 4-phosphate cytidylyltransferase [Betaproteobacteria bacterium]